MIIEIKDYEKSHGDRLSLILKEILKEEFFWFEDRVDENTFFQLTLGEKIYTAFADEKIVGFISIWEEENFIHNIFVLKKYRQIGIGRKLLRKIDENYKRPFTLKCLKANKKALKFYFLNNWQIKDLGRSNEGDYYLLELE